MNEDTNMIMPVAPAYGSYGNGGFGFGNNGDFWLILILLFAFGGWGNGGFGGGTWGADGLYPWLNNQQTISGGFQNQALGTSIGALQNSITSGFGDVATQLCGGFAGVNASVNNAQNAIAQQLYANQIADLERSFNAQTATTQGMNNIGMSLQNCCCENRQNIADVKYTVANESNATRFADANNTRDIITNQTQNTQAILDKLCALELDGIKGQLAEAQRENVSLQNQLNMATLRESQTAQNAFIAQGLNNEVDQLYNRLSNCPVPTTPVYGRTPIFTCGGGCGCGGVA